MATRLYWVPGPWEGKLALSARPRGGDWLEDEISGWKRAGIELVVSLLTPGEELDLDLRDEGSVVRANRMALESFPIQDREVPQSEAKLAETLEKISDALTKGKNVVVHCRQGVGRSGLVAACLLVKSGISPGAAVDAVSAARGVAVPETREQREWIDHYAVAFTK